MEHPLINNLSSLTMDELQSKISELNRKLSWATRSGNANLVYQIRLALDSYNSTYQQKLADSYKESNKNNPDFSDKINIS